MHLPRDKMCSKHGLEIHPRSEGDRVGIEGSRLPIFGPLASWGSDLEVRQGGRDFLVIIGIQAGIQVEVVFQGTPEVFSIFCLPRKQFWGRA